MLMITMMIIMVIIIIISDIEYLLHSRHCDKPLNTVISLFFFQYPYFSAY